MFTVAYREDVRQKIIDKAKLDHRIVAAAVIGSYAQGTVDRWSDIDLTFGVDEALTISELLSSWTDDLIREFSAIVLFDLNVGITVYRVFILPGCLQLDLSFCPAKEFGAFGPHFDLLYGKQYDKHQNYVGPPNKEIFGYLVHHLLRARFCAERNKLWQAEFWINEAKNYALKLACISKGLRSDYGRGLDELPEEILSSFENALVTKRSKNEILRVIKVIISALPGISEEINLLTVKVNTTLEELAK
ncbi:MAG: hypothetical protein ABIR66_11955 [Saprospiraceae bacterium]